jgi:hypothetical protein
MASRELYNHVLEALSLAPAARVNGTATGSTVDLLGYESALVLISTGVITDGSHAITLEDSNDNFSSDTTTVAAGDMLGTILTPLTSGSGGSAVQAVAYVGKKRYLRAKVVTSGATTGGIFAASVLRSHARHGGTR